MTENIRLKVKKMADMADSNKVLTVTLAVITCAILIVVSTWTLAEARRTEAVADTRQDTVLDIIAKDHTKRLTVHDSMFADNAKEHKQFAEQLSIYSQTQKSIASTQKAIEKSTDRIEKSQKEFRNAQDAKMDKILDKMDKFSERTTKALTWIEALDKVEEKDK